MTKEKRAEWDAHQKNIPFEERKDPTSAGYSADGRNFHLEKSFEQDNKRLKRKLWRLFISVVVIVSAVAYIFFLKK